MVSGAGSAFISLSCDTDFSSIGSLEVKFRKLNTEYLSLFTFGTPVIVDLINKIHVQIKSYIFFSRTKYIWRLFKITALFCNIIVDIYFNCIITCWYSTWLAKVSDKTMSFNQYWMHFGVQIEKYCNWFSIFSCSLN